MKSVVWDIGSSGPGVDAVRAYVSEYYVLQFVKSDFDVPSSGPFDAKLKEWVIRFQKGFNYLLNNHRHIITKTVRKLPVKNIIDSGCVDYWTRSIMNIPEDLAMNGAIELPGSFIAKPMALPALGHFASNGNEAFRGHGYLVKNLTELMAAIDLDLTALGKVSNKRIAPIKAEGKYLMVPEGHPDYPEAKKRSECAALVQGLNLPNTNQWRRGPRIQDMTFIVPGTVVATLRSGVYFSDYSGRSHVGILLRKDPNGIWLLDQFVGGENSDEKLGALGIRLKRFNNEINPTEVKHRLPYIIKPISYTVPVTSAKGESGYARDYSPEATRYQSYLTSNGSEYYVLLSEGTVVRNDLEDRGIPTAKEAARELVKFVFESIDGPWRP